MLLMLLQMSTSSILRREPAIDRPGLKFLADESCDFAFVRALRQNGYDVKAVVEVMPGVSDLKVLELGF